MRRAEGALCGRPGSSVAPPPYVVRLSVYPPSLLLLLLLTFIHDVDSAQNEKQMTSCSNGKPVGMRSECILSFLCESYRAEDCSVQPPTGGCVHFSSRLSLRGALFVRVSPLLHSSPFHFSPFYAFPAATALRFCCFKAISTGASASYTLASIPPHPCQLPLRACIVEGGAFCRFSRTHSTVVIDGTPCIP